MGDKIAELKQQLENAQNQSRAIQQQIIEATKEEEAARLAPLRETAERAHRLLCPHNHTDGCSWEYEAGAASHWDCDAHKRWLGYVDRMVTGNSYHPAFTNLEELNIVLDAIEEIKPKVPTALKILRTGFTQ